MKLTSHILLAKNLAKLLDSQFHIGKFKFGLDPLIGAFPIIGDILPLIVAIYMIWIAREVEVPQKDITRMIRNTIADILLGSLPLVGDAADFFYQSHRANWEILKKHTENIIVGEEL